MVKMRSFRWWGSLCMALVLTTACKKDPPLPTSSVPVFEAEAEIDGERINWVAGDDGFVMEASWAEGTDMIRELTGTFDRTSGRQTLGISFREENPGERIDPDRLFASGSRLFTGFINPQEPFTVSFQANSASNVGGQTYEWDFGDGNTSTEPNPSHTYTEQGVYQVQLTVVDGKGCRHVSRQEIRTGSLFLECDLSFDVELLGDNQVRCKANFNSELGQPALVWSMGDAAHYIDQNEVIHQYEQLGIYEIKLVASFPKLGVCCYIRSIYSGEGASCVSSIDYTRVVPPRDLKAVQIHYTDENGRTYSSEGPVYQPTESSFELLSAEPYEPNPEGDDTYKLELRFNCELYAEDNPNDVLMMQNAKAIIAVALP